MLANFLTKVEFGIGTYLEALPAYKRQFDSSRIIKIQNARLINIIQHCAKHIKYYRELFAAAGIDPEHIRSASDLPKIPVLPKAELKNRFWDFLAPRLQECRVTRSSGSTGTPVCILSDGTSRKYNSATVIRSRLGMGLPLARRPILTPLKSAQAGQNKPRWTYVQGIHKTYYINPYLYTDESMDYTKQIIKNLTLPTIIGITPAVKAMALGVRDGFIPKFKPGSIITYAETLEHNVREMIETTFDTKVSDVYACSEVGEVAWECGASDGYHINAENCIVEVLKNDEPVADGEVGEVAITSLHRYAMPLIRYKNGDLVRLAKHDCPCGRKLPMIAEIVGRTGDDIYLPNGKKLLWNHLKSHMTHPHIRQFQLVQDTKGNFIIKYIPEKQADRKDLDALLLKRYQSMIGDSVEIKIEHVKEIAPASSGKSKLVVSNYRPPH